MCGIAGLIDFRTNPEIDLSLLIKMSDVIIHRGPDSDGQWISDDKKCGLAFRRLAIIDLSDAGSQPMHTNDNRYHIVFNGEIYNHNDIRKDLEHKYKYHSKTDTETILYGYKEYGLEIFNKMIGMWAVAIWDSTEKKIILCRDRIGVKPLYYYFKDNLLIFGSEIKSILEHKEVKKELNIPELTNYLNYGMSSKNSSLFKNIYKVPSGHYLEVDIRKELNLKRYWSPFNKKFEYNSSEEIQQNLLERLRDAIKIRMMSDVPFGVFLSGGIDSSLNVALMNELMDRPIDTFTVGFKELEKFNELDYANQIAKLYKTNHNEILIDDKDAMNILSDLPWYEDEPNADPVCIPLYYLSKLTRESGTTVVQVGEGSDEQFIGYKWMLRDYKFVNSYWKFYKNLPQSLKHLTYNAVKSLFEQTNNHLIADILRRATYNEEFSWSGTSIYSPTHLKYLLSNEYKELSNYPAKYGAELHSEAYSLKNDANYLERLLFVELNQRLAEILLMRVDKIGMAHSIEARVPFLDHRLVEYTISIPDKFKVPNFNEPKYLLKKAVEDILPHNIIYRRKQGFAAPVDSWFRTIWYDYAKDRISNSKFMQLGILNKSFLLSLLERHKNGKNLGQELYSIINLTLWYDRWF
jgi:asparagine synthase (glutamine-hydrolysing)